MGVLATDLDRTLIDNGKEPSDKTTPLFKRLVEKKKLKLVYVTGRNLKLSQEAIKNKKLPFPDYLICNVGARIYKKKRGERRFLLDRGWFGEIEKKSEGYDKKSIEKRLKKIEGLRLQEKEKQDRFKISYYVESGKIEKATREVKRCLEDFDSFKVIESFDPEKGEGLLDIMATHANKKDALDHVVKRLEEKKSDVFYCGDSGNDLSIILSGYNSIVVNNAPLKIKRKVKREKEDGGLFVAKKGRWLNGNYSSGIIQGMVYFGIVSEEDIRSHNPSSG